jgi:hypothetical protein
VRIIGTFRSSDEDAAVILGSFLFCSQRIVNGWTNFILRIKEQETDLTLLVHNDDDDDDCKYDGMSLSHYGTLLTYRVTISNASITYRHTSNRN